MAVVSIAAAYWTEGDVELGFLVAYFSTGAIVAIGGYWMGVEWIAKRKTRSSAAR